MRYRTYEEWDCAMETLRINEDCICPCCQQESSTTLVDFGIGNTEYWGNQQIDTDVRLVSRCCEVDIGEDDFC